MKRKPTCPLCGGRWSANYLGATIFGCGTRITQNGLVIQNSSCAAKMMRRALERIAATDDPEEVRALAKAACHGSGYPHWTSSELLELLGGAS